MSGFLRATSPLVPVRECPSTTIRARPPSSPTIRPSGSASRRKTSGSGSRPSSRTSPTTSWWSTRGRPACPTMPCLSRLVPPPTPSQAKPTPATRPRSKTGWPRVRKEPANRTPPSNRLRPDLLLQLNKTTIPQKFSKMQITRLLHHQLLNQHRNLQSKKNHREGVLRNKITNRHNNRDLRKSAPYQMPC